MHQGLVGAINKLHKLRSRQGVRGINLAIATREKTRTSPRSSATTAWDLDTKDQNVANMPGIKRPRSGPCKRSSLQLELRHPRVLLSKEHGRMTSPHEKTS